MDSIQYPKVGLRDVLKYIWRAIAPQKFKFFVMLAMLLGWQIIGYAIIPLFYKQFFGTLTTVSDREVAVPILVGIIVTIGILNIFRWACRRMSEFSLASIEADGMARMRQFAFDYLIQHSHSFLSTTFRVLWSSASAVLHGHWNDSLTLLRSTLYRSWYP